MKDFTNELEEQLKVNFEQMNLLNEEINKIQKSEGGLVSHLDTLGRLIRAKDELTRINNGIIKEISLNKRNSENNITVNIEVKDKSINSQELVNVLTESLRKKGISL